MMCWEPSTDTRDLLFRALRWLTGRSGTSSRTMLAVFLSLPLDHGSSPSDDGDFGRCVALLDAVPEWRPLLPRMASVSLEWRLLVHDWETLEKLHRTGRSWMLWRRIHRIEVEANKYRKASRCPNPMPKCPRCGRPVAWVASGAAWPWDCSFCHMSWGSDQLKADGLVPEAAEGKEP